MAIHHGHRLSDGVISVGDLVQTDRLPRKGGFGSLANVGARRCDCPPSGHDRTCRDLGEEHMIAHMQCYGIKLFGRLQARILLNRANSAGFAPLGLGAERPKKVGLTTLTQVDAG